jgi:integrase/recombinase XerD
MSNRGHFKKGPKAPGNRLAVDAWPAADRAFWAKARKSGSVLKTGGRAANWKPRTVKNVELAYGEWLKWITDTQEHLLSKSPLERVTKVRVREYMDDLPKTLSPSSVQMRLQRLGQMMTAFSESKDFSWLFLAANRLKPVSVRDKRAKMQPSYRLAELGFNLMRDVASREPAWHNCPAVQYRDGLIIALLAYWPIRIGNLAVIAIGEHLVRCGDGFRLAFSAEETKQGCEIGFDVPPNLTAAITKYLDTYRPALMARGSHQGTAGQTLWVSRDGGPMCAQGIAGTIQNRTKGAFGIAVNPHLFRDCAATTIAIDDPAHAHVIASVLGHSSMITSELHYNQAGSVEAGRQYQVILDARLRHFRRSHKRGRRAGGCAGVS